MGAATAKAYDAIRAGILSGQYRPQMRLREEVLSVEIGVSRTPVREALRQLAVEGLLEFQPNRGAKVISLSQSEIDDVFEIRALLESHAARRAAIRATEEQIESLDALANEMLENVHGTKFDSDLQASLNDRFHRGIVEASGSTQLVHLVVSVVRASLVYQTFRSYSPEQRRRSANHHMELVAAMRARNEHWAGSVMRAHIFAAQSIFPETRNE